MKIIVFSSKNEDFSCFAAVYELRNVPKVFKNILNMFSNLKLICRDEGLHWNTLVLMLVAILKNRKKFSLLSLVKSDSPPPLLFGLICKPKISKIQKIQIISATVLVVIKPF